MAATSAICSQSTEEELNKAMAEDTQATSAEEATGTGGDNGKVHAGQCDKPKYALSRRNETKME